jgi:endonuclease YncB( thermonuclease family)
MKRTCLAVLLLLCNSLCFAANNGAAELIKKGDRFDAELKTSEAMALYLEAEKLDPNNLDLLCRLAKTHDEAMVDTPSKAEQRRLGEVALEYAKRAVALDPKSSKANLSMAITYGRLAPYLDNKTKIAYSKLVKEYADRALELDASNDYGYHILAAWHYEMAKLSPFLRVIVKLIYGELPSASFEQAEANFRKAVALAPNRISHHIELGRAYAALNKKDLAREEIAKGLALPIREKDDAATKQRGQDTLAKL